jgi:S-adenosyl-L-methionine hydrolase (adenosine-forming)
VIVALLTDFGLTDGFVAACHGVIARIAPGVRVLDVTHLVPPGDIRRGAAVLVVGVVDPGVGTNRRAVVVRAGPHLLVGPDNGLLPGAADAVTPGGPERAWQVSNRALGLAAVSRTFHGRDVFSPLAAHLATGTPPAEAGPEVPVGTLVRLPEPVRRAGPGAATGEVLTVDRYGNLQTALTERDLAAAGLSPGDGVAVRVGPVAGRARYGETFGSAGAGELVLYRDSAGLVAVAVNGGDAAARLSAAAGDLVLLEPVD